MTREAVVQFDTLVPLSFGRVVRLATDNRATEVQFLQGQPVLVCGRSVADRGAHNAFVTGSIPVRTTRADYHSGSEAACPAVCAGSIPASVAKFELP